jgi:hypothetical protein
MSGKPPTTGRLPGLFWCSPYQYGLVFPTRKRQRVPPNSFWCDFPAAPVVIATVGFEFPKVAFGISILRHRFSLDYVT